MLHAAVVSFRHRECLCFSHIRGINNVKAGNYGVYRHELAENCYIALVGLWADDQSLGEAPAAGAPELRQSKKSASSSVKAASSVGVFINDGESLSLSLVGL